MSGTPACLPLYSDYIPSIDDLLHKFDSEIYTLPVTAGMESFLLRPAKNVTDAAGQLLRGLVYQRLSQSFQIIMPSQEMPGADPSSRRNSQTGEIALPTASDVREILLNTTKGEGLHIYLGFSNSVHRIHFDRQSSSIVVKLWKEKAAWSSKPHLHKFLLWPSGGTEFEPRSVLFDYPDLNTYDWRHADRLVSGWELPELRESSRYWRTRFTLLPATIPDPDGVRKSQSKVLAPDSTHEDIRMAGIMALYEQFSKARWLPSTKEKAKKTKLVPLYVQRSSLSCQLSDHVHSG